MSGWSGSEKKADVGYTETVSSVSKSFFTDSSSKFRKISKRVFKRFFAGEYQELENDLVLYRLTKEQITDFFLAEGHSILNWAIVSALNAKPLAFLSKIVDRLTLKKVLLSDDLTILQDFLFAESGLERGGVENYEEVKASQIEKIRLMLDIDRETLEGFIKEKISTKSRCVTKNMESNFNEALAPAAKLPKQEKLTSSFSAATV